MPKNATIQQRIAWHNEHAKVCGCPPIRARLLQIIEKENTKNRLNYKKRLLYFLIVYLTSLIIWIALAGSFDYSIGGCVAVGF
jgi:hypothetical protein